MKEEETEYIKQIRTAAFNYLKQNRDTTYLLLRRYITMDKAFLLRSELWDEFLAFCDETNYEGITKSPLAELIYTSQEAITDAPWIYFAIRPRVARWTYLRIHIETMDIDRITVSEYLGIKERLVGADQNGRTLEIDLDPFNRGFPKLQESRSIGRGVEFLNRKLSSQLFQEDGKGFERLLRFLKVHHCRGAQLMLNDRIRSVQALRQALRRAEDYLSTQPQDAGWDDVSSKMHDLGFAIGWGNVARRMRNSLGMLSDILEAPEPNTLEKFLGRIPMIFNIVILSPHGYFGQANVLGMPDTGGQVVYILDQVRALEKEMRRRLSEQGIMIDPQIVVVTRLIPEAGNTTCDQRIENITGTQNARILRVPFRNKAGEVVPQWISRFEVWPYLDRFTMDVEKELSTEFEYRPDLIIGNYSDGNLVASILSNRLQVTQCNIAHALEKNKYLYSDLYWKDNEERYHFSCQFTADLISMNTADFIITSTYQEIAGNVDSIGQYESYSTFTMPGLYRVVHGIDMFDPKFNIVSPGADAEVYFSHRDKERRLAGLRDELESLVFGNGERPDARGSFEDRSKPILFTLARLDRIKNITGLVDWFGNSERLREKVNLLIIAGHLDQDKSSDAEEREQIGRMHDLMNYHKLDGQLRWLGVHLEKNMSAELYRYIADLRGAFVQPAMFEAFGLTVIEAMTSGLPIFATCYGGPLEIIEHGVSGFHINPNHGEEAADIMADFFEKCASDPGHWDKISEGAEKRVEERYTWKLYAERMMTLSRVYGFWKYVTNLERDETRRYLELLYGLQFRKLAESVPH
ncbi:sucrose synthase [hydrothermal vent metagenome]|uniref:sucrose synthase n=1 Tax=hydrothermal vent metagenome TaxID=652676 RepID=A0A3B1CHL1_9ZZZZ